MRTRKSMLHGTIAGGTRLPSFACQNMHRVRKAFLIKISLTMRHQLLNPNTALTVMDSSFAGMTDMVYVDPPGGTSKIMWLPS